MGVKVTKEEYKKKLRLNFCYKMNMYYNYKLFKILSAHLYSQLTNCFDLISLIIL